MTLGLKIFQIGAVEEFRFVTGGKIPSRIFFLIWGSALMGVTLLIALIQTAITLATIAAGQLFISKALKTAEA